jgi:hypothetical protein
MTAIDVTARGVMWGAADRRRDGAAVGD